MVITIWTIVILATGANVSSLSRSYYYRFSSATSQALYRSRNPSAPILMVYTHLHSTGFTLEGQGMMS